MPKKQTVASAKWQADNVTQILIKPNVKLDIPNRIQRLIDAGKADSRQGFIIAATLAALEKAEKDMDANN